MLKRLQKRLEIVKRRIGSCDGEVRQIHRLRVATRKALSAIQVCRPLLAKSFARHLEKSLKAQRKSLGPVRDWDVLIARVLCTPADQRSDTRCDLLLHLASERERSWKKASRHLAEALEESKFVGKKRRKLPLRKPKQGAPATAIGLFRAAIRQSLELIQTLGASVREDAALEMKRLHQLRVACKGLRYLMEFREELTPSSHETLSAMRLLTEAQQRLGDLHDLAEQPALLKRAARRAPPAVEKWLELASKQARERAGQEASRYRQWQQSGGFLAALQTLAPR